MTTQESATTPTSHTMLTAVCKPDGFEKRIRALIEAQHPLFVETLLGEVQSLIAIEDLNALGALVKTRLDESLTEQGVRLKYEHRVTLMEAVYGAILAVLANDPASTQNGKRVVTSLNFQSLTEAWNAVMDAKVSPN